MIISAWNPETTDLEKTNLSAVVQKNGAYITVKNTDRFPVGSIILLGEMGMEQSELLNVATYTTIPEARINLSGNTVFAHVADEPVYKMRYDEVLFYRASTVDGTYTLISTQDIDVDNADNKTYYEDNAGSATSYYKTKYHNSVTSEETDFSDPISATGQEDGTIGEVIDIAVRRIKDGGYNVLAVDDYLDIATEVNHDITSQSEKPYSFMRKAVLINRVAGDNELDMPEDYFKFYLLEYTNTVGSYPKTKRLNPIAMDQFLGNYGATASSDYTTRIALDQENKKILLKPTPRTNATGAFKLWYYGKLLPFTSTNQSVQTPNNLIYKYKFLAEAYSVKAEVDPSFGQLATKYEQKYGNELMKLQRSNRKDVGTPRSFADTQTLTSTPPYEGRRYSLNG